MSRSFRTVIGFAAVFVGLFMFMGSSLRMGHSARFAERHAQFEAHADMLSDSAETTPSSTSSSVGSSPFEQANSQQAHRGHRGHHGFGVFGFLIRLALLGLLLKFIFGKIRQRRRGHSAMHAEASSDDIANDIRVGDEIDRDAPPVSADDLTVDDLLHAMKRLGIKKLEL